MDARAFEQFDTHKAILGKTGSGKTVTAKGSAERILEAGERFCAIDPTGAWWGLRLQSDGMAPAYDVAIFGGRYGDVPIGKASGGRLGELLGTRNTPAIIDTSSMSVTDRTAFLTDFGDTIYNVNHEPLHLFIDEAHIFAPKNKMRGQERMLHAANNLATGGRSRGFRITMITQRPAKLHNDMLAGAEILVAHKMILPHDVEAVRRWIGEYGDPKTGQQILKTLATLKKGEAWVWAPDLEVLERTQFPMCETYDSSSTPKAGQAKTTPAPLEREEMAELVALLERDEKPVGRGTKVNSAKAQVTSSGVPDTVTALIKALQETAPAVTTELCATLDIKRDKLAVHARDNLGLRGLSEALERTLSRAQQDAFVDGVATGLADAAKSIEALQGKEWPTPGYMAAPFDGVIRTDGDMVALPFVTTQTQAARLAKKEFAREIEDKPAKATDADAAIRSILAHGPRPWADVAILCGYAMSGGGFRAARKRLTEGALIREGASGPELVGPYSPHWSLPTPAETVQLWKRKLGGSAGAVLEDLFRAGGASTIDSVCARTDYVATGGGFRSALKKLRNNGLLTQTRNALELADVLKPKGRRA